MVTWLLPMLMKWDIRQEALSLARTLSGGHPELEPGEFDAISPIATRVYSTSAHSQASGKTALDIDRAFPEGAVESVTRVGTLVPLTDTTTIQADDEVAFTGSAHTLALAGAYFGQESTATGVRLVEENREIVLTNRALANRDLATIRSETATATQHGVFLTKVRRMGHELPLLSKLTLHRGDELHFVGRTVDLDRVQGRIGYKISAGVATDFIFFGVGMTIGLLLGMIEFKLGGVPVSIGSGGGCLLSGLFFGWLRGVHPRFAALPTGASTFLRDFGLAVFVGVVGITAGPQALTAIRESGLTLLFLGVAATLLPIIVTFLFSYYVLRVRNPIEALACVAGGRSANPAFAALLQKAGNATPVVSFTVTYAVANIFLTLWGPIIVGLITKNAT